MFAVHTEEVARTWSMHPGRMGRVEQIQSPPKNYRAMHLDCLASQHSPFFSLPCSMCMYVCMCMYPPSGIVRVYMLPYVYFMPFVKVDGGNVGNL